VGGRRSLKGLVRKRFHIPQNGAASDVQGGRQIVSGGDGSLCLCLDQQTPQDVAAALTPDMLEGDAQFFSLNLVSADRTTTGTTPVSFQTAIPANFNDSYTMTVLFLTILPESLLYAAHR
jgi:hypothetical protein